MWLKPKCRLEEINLIGHLPYGRTKPLEGVQPQRLGRSMGSVRLFGIGLHDQVMRLLSLLPAGLALAFLLTSLNREWRDNPRLKKLLH